MKGWSEMKGATHGTGSQKFTNPSLVFRDAFLLILGDAFTTLQLSFSLQQTGDRAPVYLISGDLNRKYSTIH